MPGAVGRPALGYADPTDVIPNGLCQLGHHCHHYSSDNPNTQRSPLDSGGSAATSCPANLTTSFCSPQINAGW